MFRARSAPRALSVRYARGSPKERDTRKERNQQIMTVNSYKLACAVVAAAAMVGCTQSAPKKNPNAVKLEFFIMSQCPYGVQVENAIKDVADKLGPDLDLAIEFIGDVGQNGELSSMHGPNEVAGDMVQACAMKYAPAKALDMIVCQNKNMREVQNNWEQCAKDTGIPADKLKACKDGDEGKQLLKASFERAKAKPAQGSPTIFLSGKPYNGRRSSGAFLRAVCNEISGTKPGACAGIAEPAAVSVTVLGDKRCTDCSTDRYVGMLKSRIENPVIKAMDYTEAEGKTLYESLGNKGNLPMVLFDASLEKDSEASQLFARHLQPAGSYRTLALGGSWNPVCMNEGGCKLPECKNTLACRAETPKKLEVFVMSQCPYGVRALDAMNDVLKAFENKIDFTVHFIPQGDPKNLQSMHGQAEVDENIREICAAKYYGKNMKYMDYIWCRNKNIRDTNWQACTGGQTGIDTKVIEKCFAGDEGKKLLEQDMGVAQSLGIGASPTWVANGKFKFSGIDAASIQSSFCAQNKGLKGCEKAITSATPAAPVQGGCGN